MLQAGSDYKHMASSQLLASGQDQFNLSNPRKSSSSRSGKHQCLVQQVGRLHPQPHSMTLARVQLPQYSVAGHLWELW